MELSLADVLDGFISRPGSGHRAREQLRVGELPGEWNFQALNIEESVRREESFARTRRPSDIITAWLSTFSAVARPNGASAQAPGEIFR
jgi:hypothetical protein